MNDLHQFDENTKLKLQNAQLQDEIARLKAEITELQATVYLLKNDVDVLGPENRRLSNAYNLAKAEIARLTTRKKKGRPSKTDIGDYELYLFREAIEVMAESKRNGGKKLSEKKAAVIANERIRKTAISAHKADMIGPFSKDYSSDEPTIYAAFRRAKRALGFSTKK